MQKTLCCYERNNLYGFLTDLLGKGTVAKMLNKYTIGTAKRWPGANVFWYQDGSRRPIDARITCFDRESGKPSGDKPSEWLTEAIEQEQNPDRHTLLFYGLHLVTEMPDSPIAIVEDEKSAIVCSHFLPQYIWLSASSLDACVWEKTDLQFIVNRQVVIFPSLCSYSQWKQISFLIAGKGIRSVVSDYIEHHANELERADGLGIADFLLKKVLAEKQTVHLKHLSPAEQLEKMKAENPAVQMLIDIFDLELVNTIEPPRRIKRQTEGACSDRD